MMTLPFWLSTEQAAALKQQQFEFEKQMQIREAMFNERMAKLELAAGVKANAAGTTTQFGGDVG